MRRFAGLHRSLLLAALVLPLIPDAAAGQTLEERRLEYNRALTTLQNAAAARDVYSRQFYILLDSLTLARTSEDEERVDQLEGRVRGVSLPLQDADVMVGDAEDQYEAARASLLLALDRRLDSLRIVAETSDDPTERADARTLIVDLRTQYAAVEDEALREQLGSNSFYTPAIAVEPRDTPATLLAKAQLLESKAEDFEELIEQVDQALDRFRRAAELDRFTGDVRSSLDRFGDTQVPVRGRTDAGRGQQGIVPDTVTVDLEALPPDVAVTRLEVYRNLLVEAYEQTIRRAREFRDLIRGARGGVR